MDSPLEVFTRMLLKRHFQGGFWDGYEIWRLYRVVEKNKFKKTEGKKQVTVSQMQKTNQILVEKFNLKNENAYEGVKTNDDIVEMKRKQYTQIEDGTTKVSVISKQFLNITKCGLAAGEFTECKTSSCR